MVTKIRKLLGRKKIPIYITFIGMVMLGLLAVRWGMTSEADDATTTDTSKYYFSIENGKYEYRTTTRRSFPP